MRGRFAIRLPSLVSALGCYSPQSHRDTEKKEGFLCDSVVEKVIYSPYGTQMFFTCVACCRNHRPSLCFTSNQSIARPSLVNTCFKFPVEKDFAAAALLSSPKHQ